eukprot:m.103710 g.103710  ORF g.103710 m.103710 type:complete len:264 (+) comp12622_c0_seq2:263-1054(+)
MTSSNAQTTFLTGDQSLSRWLYHNLHFLQSERLILRITQQNVLMKELVTAGKYLKKKVLQPNRRQKCPVLAGKSATTVEDAGIWKKCALRLQIQDSQWGMGFFATFVEERVIFRQSAHQWSATMFVILVECLAIVQGENAYGRGGNDYYRPRPPPSSKTCYTCGDFGHISSSCPRGSKGTKLCHVCQEVGHIARDCNKCKICKKEGHRSYDCPDRHTSSGSRSSSSYHRSSDPYRPSYESSRSLDPYRSSDSYPPSYDSRGRY